MNKLQVAIIRKFISTQEKGEEMGEEPEHLEVIKHKKEESLAIRAAKHFFDLATVRRGKEPYEWLVGEREFIRNKISDLFQGQKVNKNKPLKIIIDYDPDYEYATVRFKNTEYKPIDSPDNNRDYSTDTSFKIPESWF